MWLQTDVVESFLQPSDNDRVPRRSLMVELLREHQVRSVLELGCGLGQLRQAILAASLPCAYQAIERSPKMIALARQLNPTLAVIEGDAEAIPFPDRSFDAVICEHVLEHLPHYRTALAEMARVAQRVVLIGWFNPPSGAPTRLRILHLSDYPDHWENCYNRRDVEDEANRCGLGLQIERVADSRHCVWVLNKAERLS